MWERISSSHQTHWQLPFMPQTVLMQVSQGTSTEGAVESGENWHVLQSWVDLQSGLWLQTSAECASE